MSSRLRSLLPALLCTLAWGCAESPATELPPPGSEPLRVRRGSIEQRYLLTGELQAEKGSILAVPRIPQWQTSVKWLESDGAMVVAGQKLVELDNTPFASTLAEKRLAAAQAEQNLAKEGSRFAAELGEKTFELERRRLDVEKARIEASVPQSVVSIREHQDRQLALARAEVELRKAEANVAALKKSVQADLANLRLELQKTASEIDAAEKAISELTLHAPQSGIIVIAEHPAEGRKLQFGDNVWVGMPLLTIPDLSTIQVVASLSDVDDGAITVGMPADMTLDAHPGERFVGRVTEVGPVAQEMGPFSLRRAFRVIIRPDRVDSTRMRPGLSVKASIRVGQRSNVLLIPRGAIDFADPRKPLACLAGGSRVQVRLGPCNAHQCVVESGLEEGTRLEAAS